MVSAPGKVDKVKGFGNSWACFPLPSKQERQFDVFRDSHCRKQIEELKDDTEVVPAIPGQG